MHMNVSEIDLKNTTNICENKSKQRYTPNIQKYNNLLTDGG